MTEMQEQTVKALEAASRLAGKAAMLNEIVKGVEDITKIREGLFYPTPKGRARKQGQLQALEIVMQLLDHESRELDVELKTQQAERLARLSHLDTEPEKA